MTRIIILAITLLLALTGSAQVQVNDTMFLFLDSIYAELPEVMISGERPIVKAEEGKLIYDLPRLVNALPVDNAYDALKELPGVIEQNETLTLAGGGVNVIIDGKVSTLTQGQLTTLLKTIPVSQIQNAEVMYSAPARYQVRGPMINLVLKKGDGATTKLQGEVYSLWQQKHYEKLTERASLLYYSAKFSTDLLYSYTHGRTWFGIDKEALHTVNGTVYPMNLRDRTRSQGNTHNIRWGMDYSFTPQDVLSFVYTSEISNTHSHAKTSGTGVSSSRKKSDNYLHNFKLDYRTAFGLSTGAEFTFYKAPANQNLLSTLNDETVNARYEDEQRINNWRFYAIQEHSLKNNWGLNYGAHYTTAVDNSYQFYYDGETDIFDPDKSMKSRKKEYTINGFAGFNKTFGDKLSMDASLAAELYHTNIWDEWMFYPTLNLNYTPAPGHILQLAFSSDKTYPSYWEMNNSVSYMSAYTEIHGNPDLKPTQEYETSFTYILKGKYVLTVYFNHDKDYSVQTLYQRPDRLVEIYKTFNFDYRQQFGLRASIPLKIGNWLNTRLTLVGCQTREKDSDFWDTSFNRDKYSFIGVMNNTLTLSTKPDLRLNINGFYQSGAIQGIYDLSPSFNLDASLRWTFADEKAQLTLRGLDLFETSSIKPKIRFENQNVTNKFTHPTRGFELSFSYKFGNYKEKKREDVDTSRFK